MISNYIGIERVIEKINRFKIPGGYWNLEELKEWTYDSLEAIGNTGARVKMTGVLQITDNKAKIPAEIEVIDSIYDNSNNERLEEILPYKQLDSGSYLLNAGYIYTDFSDGEGELTINYSTIPLDKAGNPLIPDNRLYISAIEAYIQYMIGKRAFYSGKILGQQFQMLEQEWLYYLPAAQASQKMDIVKDPQRFARIHNKFVH